jgi:hypothetical protein
MAAQTRRGQTARQKARVSRANRKPATRRGAPARYEAGKCHVCGQPQQRNKVLCPEHEAQWRRGKLRLSEAGARRMIENGQRQVTLSRYGETRVVRASGRPGKEKS